MTPPQVGFIVIGRNEGDRLARCLNSLAGGTHPVVYVDSGSTDSSIPLAQSINAEVVELDRSLPFSAARGRNAGFQRLSDRYNNLPYVMFVDGDCEVVQGWLDAAIDALSRRPDVAVVCGRRRERFPDRSIYNALCDIEWDTPVGDANSCGGDAVIRSDAFRAAGGFNVTVPAGEEPELCHRLRRAGARILRLDADMTLHDAAITRFNQWWNRNVRTGYGGLNVELRFGIRHFTGMLRSAWFWGLGIPLGVLSAGLAGTYLGGPGVGVLSAAVVGLAFPLQILRLAARIRRRGHGARLSLAYGFFTVLGKWPQLIGQLRYLRHQLAAKPARLIEYKRRITGIQVF